MPRTHRRPLEMKLAPLRFGIHLSMIGTAILVTSCGSSPEVPAEPSPSEPEIAITIAEDAPLAITIADQPAVKEQSECLLCHADKQRLIDTARPEEEHISENSGVG